MISVISACLSAVILVFPTRVPEVWLPNLGFKKALAFAFPTAEIRNLQPEIEKTKVQFSTRYDSTQTYVYHPIAELYN